MTQALYSRPMRRRRWLSMAATPWLPAVTAWAQQTPGETAKAMPDVRSMGLSSQGIRLAFPELADTGNSVPLAAEIDAPTGLRIASIEVLLPENPSPLALRIRLPQPAQAYRFSTRLRLAASQDAWVLVTFSDGSQRAASASTVITASACLDGT